MKSNENRNPYEGVGKAAWEKRRLIQEDYPGNLYKEAYGDYETVLNEDQIRGLFVAMCFLEPRQRMVLEMRYQDKMAFSEIAKIIDVTIERVRQIEHKAMRGLRTPRQHKLVTNGFEGYIRLLRESDKKKNYDRGYLDGYYKGVKEAGSGVVKSGISVRIVDLPIEALCLTPATQRCLRESGFEKIAELLVLDKKEVKRIPKVTTKRRREIAEGLKRYQIRNVVWDFYLPYEQKHMTNKENDK